MDELRFRSQQSPRNESPMNSLVSPPRNGTRLPQPMPAHDPRTSLPRRFTTDSGRVPTLSTIAPAAQRVEPQDYSTSASTLQKVQLLEKKKQEYERLREQKRRFEAEMQKLEHQQRREEQELAQMQEDLGRFGSANGANGANGGGVGGGVGNGILPGRQSEPTTPPEYREPPGFPSMFSRPNRYSTSSLASPPGIFNRPARSGSQLASPQAGILQPRFAFDDQLPSRSVPGSRRNSDEDEKEEAVRQDPTSHRSTNALNRYSMPVTRSRTTYDMGLDQANTTGFLFGDDEGAGESKGLVAGSTDDFPTLVRAEARPDFAKLPNGNATNGWGAVSTLPHRLSLQSGQLESQLSNLKLDSGLPSDVSTIGSRPSSIRHSLDLKYYGEPSSTAADSQAPPNHVLSTPPKLQSSFSTNDIPTVKTTPAPAALGINANNHAQQHFHNHNASIGRIPAGVMQSRHSRDLSSDATNAVGRESVTTYQSLQSALQGNAAPFGPVPTAAQVHHVQAQAPGQQGPMMPNGPGAPAVGVPQVGGPYNGYYNGGGNYANPHAHAAQVGPVNGSGYPVQMLAVGMQGMNLGNGSMYPAQNYTGYGALYPQSTSQPRDSQARVIQHRRQMDNEAMSRYANLPLESVGGQIYELCKDQHGCRYLQKQLENRNPEQVHMIWLETNQHVVELMTDPFGNYLCQKLLEYCNDDERTVLIQNSAQDMVRIALNQHGTRALQKMIEFVNTKEQVEIIIDALRFRVVDLIQDLNGNHVIQKCLNKLPPEDSQFIFDAVGNHCIDVGTHRHGCCVLQRCIDHASGDQKLWLISKITENAYTLVQDPFGNYVVQYIIDLNEPTFTEPVVLMFNKRIVQLSRHKFSSNVIEKCLRCALDPSKDMIVEELLTPGEMDRLLRDSFANYVVQTALEYATPYMKHRLVEAIRPQLPAIRNTPYGRRIQAKIQTHDGRSGQSSGQATPSDPTGGQVPLRTAHARASSNANSLAGSNGGGGGGGGGLPMPPALSAAGTAPPVMASAPAPVGLPGGQGHGNNNGYGNGVAVGPIGPPRGPPPMQQAPSSGMPHHQQQHQQQQQMMGQAVYGNNGGVIGMPAQGPPPPRGQPQYPPPFARANTQPNMPTGMQGENGEPQWL